MIQNLGINSSSGIILPVVLMIFYTHAVDQ